VRAIAVSGGCRIFFGVVPDDLPAVTRARIVFEILQAFVDDVPVPVGDGNRLGRGRDSVPKRLQVVDLLVDRKIVKSGRRECDGLGRVASGNGLRPG